jgi:tRNA(Glu) U13 pseudouridine synthase TruD
VSRRIKEFGLQPIAGDLVFVDNNDYQEVVDQEGTVVASDEFPKRPRKKAKKAAALAAREAAARAEAGDTNSAEEKDEDEKETDGTSKSNVDDDDDDDMKDTDDTENKGEEEGEAVQKDDGGSPAEAVERSAEENTGTGIAEENVGGTTDDIADEDVTEENAGEGPMEENAGEGPTEENPEGSKSCALLDYNQKTPAVRAITEEELDSIKIEDIVLPLPGHNVVYPNNVIKQWYEELLAVDGLSFTAMKQNVR